jgi:hypothetical protein
MECMNTTNAILAVALWASATAPILAATSEARPHLGWAAMDPPAGCRELEGAVMEEPWMYARWACADGYWLVFQKGVERVGQHLRGVVVDELRLPMPPRGGLEAELYLSCFQDGRTVLAYAPATVVKGRLPKWTQAWGFDTERARLKTVPPTALLCEFGDD